MTPRRPDLLTAEHDLDGIPPGTTPARSIVVCTPPGAGSDPVADLLQRCGAGVPLEYFDIDAVAAPLARRWRVINLDDYVAALHHHRCADSGVFGLVLRWHHLRRLHRQVAGLKPMTAEQTLAITTTIAPNPTFVLVRSPEPEHAAVARDTGERDDSRAIAERLALLEATEQAWFQWFDASDIRPLEISVGPRWELAAPVETFIDALGLTVPPGGPGPTATREPSAAEGGLLRRFGADRGGRAALP